MTLTGAVPVAAPAADGAATPISPAGDLPVAAVEGSAQAAALVERPDLAVITVVTSAHPGGEPDSAHVVGSSPYTAGSGPDRGAARDTLAAAGWSLTGPWAASGAGVYIAAVRRDLPHL